MSALKSVAAHITAATDKNDLESAAEALRSLVSHDDPLIPAEWLSSSQKGLLRDDWQDASALFISNQFIGSTGCFLFVAPYSIRRDGALETRMSLLAGRVMAHSHIPCPDRALFTAFGQTAIRLPIVLPVEVYASSGFFGREEGEAFIVPDGWPFPNAERGPALNDMREHARRFARGQECIRQIFCPTTAEFLLSSLSNDQDNVRHIEYQLHDFGHASGLGLEEKLARDLLSDTWRRAVEEWRSDAVAFHLASCLLDTKAAAEVVSSNICTRLGMDAHRLGGLHGDADVNASLLTFASLLAGNRVRIDEIGQLSLKDCTAAGLLAAVSQMARDGLDLTRQELLIDSPESLAPLYDGVCAPEPSRSAFQAHVLAPCAGVFKSLR